MANKPPPRKKPDPITTGLANYDPAAIAVAQFNPTPAEIKVFQSMFPTQQGKNDPAPVITSSSSASAAPVPAPPPAPILPKFNPMTSSSTNFKVAPSDIIQFDDSSVEIALITDLLFEDIGATELANISRSDLIDGTEVIYAPIKNLPTIRRDYDPRNVIATSTSDYFSRFAIDLSSRGVIEPYFDAYGNLVVEIETVEDGEDIQVQILSNGTIDLVEII